MNNETKAPGAAETADLYPDSSTPRGFVPLEEHAALMLELIELRNVIDKLPKELDPQNAPPGCADLAALNRDIRTKLAGGDTTPLEETGDLLVAQIHALDKLFDHVIQRSFLDTLTMIDTERLRVALLAQRQCNYTSRTLHWAKWKNALNFAERTEGIKK